MRYKEIKDKIKGKYESLPKNQKIVADFFGDNFDKIPFLSVQDVSKETAVSVASIVRFAQSVGFRGYLELRDEIGKTLQSHIEKKEIFSLVDTEKLSRDSLTHVANQDIKNINDTVQSIDRNSFDKAIKTILASVKVYTGGLGISYLLADILSYQLNQVGVHSFPLTHNYSTFPEQILYLGKKDCLILFSFPPYSKETIEAAKLAASRNIKVIAVTNKNASPITHSADSVLVVSSQNMLYTNSFAAISVLINAITTECAFRNKTKAKKMITELNEVAEKQNLLISS